MCGIVGYSGKRSAQEVLLNGLEKLEYRGYDSAGVALALEGSIHVVKSKGRLEVLRRKLEAENLPESFCGIGHTRWATHGEPSDVNSHPHSTPRVSIVHNGIIENYGPLKADLLAKGVTFESETDTEVLVKLIDYFCCAQPKQSPLAALREALAMVRGSYALGVLFREEPDTIYAVKKESPLIVGWGEGENFVASDIPALLKYTRRYSVLEEGDMAVVKKDDGTVNVVGNVVGVETGNLKYELTATVEPTCTTPGKRVYTCTTEGHKGEIYEVTIDALGHKFVNGVCTRCGAPESNGGSSAVVLTVTGAGAYETSMADGRYVVAAPAEAAVLSGCLSNLKELKAQGVNTLVFRTQLRETALNIDSMLSLGVDDTLFTLTHSGESAELTVGGVAHNELLH